MQQGLRARVSNWAGRRSLQVAVLTCAVAASAAAATPLAHVAKPVFSLSAAAAAEPAAPAPAPEVLVWQGADLDGDGKADFANPTGEAPRTHDVYGEGAFGASRDGGARPHEGVDFRAHAGQTVEAPISGYVTKIGYAYPGDESLKFVEITNPALHYEARVFYVNPQVEVGEAVAVGHPIGTAHTLQRRYPGGMTDHVHLELVDRRGQHVDAQRLIVARMEPADTGVMAAAD
ncbi:MAG: M23 family metallopeptidase [Caulobacterales bacterium]|nr:M23 family metallopeptidase [Caulobacterales bacterium]